MKSIKQIQRKVKKLTARLDGQKIHEEFGIAEYHQLCKFVGCLENYKPHTLKSKVVQMLCDFFDWCRNYTGE